MDRRAKKSKLLIHPTFGNNCFIVILGTSRKKPMFPIELWNAYDRTIMNLPPSNNFIEERHNACVKHGAIAHQSVIKLAEKIRLEQ